MNQPSSSTSRKRGVRTILWAGIVSGTLDAIAAVIMFRSSGGTDPARVFQFIASGIFGADAFSGGTMMVVWGIAFHFILALIFAAFFFFIYPQIRLGISRPMAIGLLYGLLIWVIMNRIVLPLSNAPTLPLNLSKAIMGIVVLMVLVGVPISLIVHKHYSTLEP